MYWLGVEADADDTDVYGAGQWSCTYHRPVGPLWELYPWGTLET